MLSFLFTNFSFFLFCLILKSIFPAKICLNYDEIFIFIQSSFLMFFSCSYYKLFPSLEECLKYLIRYKFNFSDVKLSFKYFLLFLGVILLLILPTYFFFYFNEYDFSLSNFHTKYDFFFSSYRFFIYFISFCFLGPLAEELFFRKLFYSFLRTKMSFIFSSFYSSLFFALVHPSRIFFAFVAGVFLSYIYEKNNNLFINFCVHSLFNIFALSIRFIFFYFD